MPYLICETPEQLTIALEVVSRYPSSVDWRAETPKHAVLNALPFLHMRVADAEKTGRRITGLFPRHVWRYVPSDRETEVVLESVTDGLTLPAEYHDDPRRALHWSNEKPGMIAYAPDEVSLGTRNYRRTTLGKYLARYCAHIAERERTALALALTTARQQLDVLHITQDADEIATVYQRMRSSSCMYRPETWTVQTHPARVYAGPDLALAYLGTLDAPIARAVVWPEKKRYCTVYDTADDARMRSVLERHGYTRGDFDGARVQAIQLSGNRYRMPYVDGAEYAMLDGAYWRLGDGDVSVRDTCGYVYDEPSERQCDHCGDTYRPQSHDDDSGYCESCDNARSPCDHCHDETFEPTHNIPILRYDTRHESQYDGYVCQDCYRGHYTFVCAAPRPREVWHDGFVHPLHGEVSPAEHTCDVEWTLDQLTRQQIAERRARGVDDYCPACAERLRMCACGALAPRHEPCACGSVPRCAHTLDLLECAE